MATAIQRLAEEDPTFKVRSDEETSQTIIGGMGGCTSRCWSTGCAVSSGGGQRRQAAGGLPRDHHPPVDKVEYTHKKQTGGSGQFRPRHHGNQSRIPPGEGEDEPGGYAFINKVTGGRIPRYIPSVDAGCKEPWTTMLAGYPMVDVQVTLLDGAYHDVDSSELAFKIAGSMAFKEGVRRAGPRPTGADDGR